MKLRTQIFSGYLVLNLLLLVIGMTGYRSVSDIAGDYDRAINRTQPVLTVLYDIRDLSNEIVLLSIAPGMAISSEFKSVDPKTALLVRVADYLRLVKLYFPEEEMISQEVEEKVLDFFKASEAFRAAEDKSRNEKDHLLEILRQKHASLLFKIEAAGLGELEEFRELQVEVEGMRKRHLRLILVVSLITILTAIAGGALLSRHISKQKEEMERQVYLAAKLVSIGELAAGVAHEINNPLAIIIGNLEDMKDELADKDIQNDFIKRALAVQETATKRIKNIANSLRKFSYTDQNEKESCFDIHTVIRETINLIQTIFAKKNINISLDLNCRHPVVCGYPGEVQQLFMNLFTNSLHALKEKNPGEIKIATRDLENKKGVEIIFSDNGSGIGKEILPRIFDPFYTTKSPDEGTGLGLSISYGIVKKIQGKIAVVSKVGEGTTFTITLPCCAKPKKIQGNVC